MTYFDSLILGLVEGVTELLPSPRGQLIAELEAVAARAGHKRIGIGVGLGKGYEQARRLYPRPGYAPDGRGTHLSQWGEESYLIKEFGPESSPKTFN